MDLYRLFENKDNGCQESTAATNVLTYNQRTKLMKEENYFNTDKEVEEVDSFIKENNLVNILSMITNYVKVVAQKWNLHWSPALIAIYIKVYKLVRHHYPEACEWQPLDMASGRAVLLYGELLLDRWLANGKQRSAPSPLAGSLFGGDFSSLTFGNLSVLCSELGDEDAEFVVRCYWLEAIMYLHVKSRDAVMIALERYLADGRCCGVHLKLKNVANNFHIDEDNVMRLYNTLKRNEELDKVTDLFARGDHSAACGILEQCLQPSSPLLAADCVDPLLDRCTQYSLLLDSLFERGQHAQCLNWCEMAAHEALTHYRATDDTHPSRARWLPS
ncbi:calcineurin-binding protein cabin-1-like [Nilaparvata lugens]|uniref:calcineurin-binding protein cabin-1-like n=1 Tax=Nilaparvata lugens TaxID=108931 RepID=UPI00193E03D3|nr:calcineurin-binding protein cabin-1-like [Nilaparvata lugens]